MQKRSRVVSALALCLAILSSTSAVSAATPLTGAETDNGAFVVLGRPPGSGPIEFTYGWTGTSQFEAPPVGYWLGIYDITNSHYVWASENPLPPLAATAVGSTMMESVEFHYTDAVGGLPPGEYYINFFVRSSYTPATNVAVVSLRFRVK